MPSQGGHRPASSPLLWGLEVLPEEVWIGHVLLPPSRAVMLLSTSKRVRALVRRFSRRVSAEIRVPAYAAIPSFLPTLSKMLADVDMISLDVARPAALCPENPPIGIGMHGWVALSGVLAQHPDSLRSLTRLKLQDNFIGNRHGQDFTFNIQGMRSLADYSTFTSSYFHGQQDYMQVLGMCTSLTELNVSNNHLNRGDIKAMSSKIALMTNLTALNLSSNVMGALGVRDVTLAMKACTRLVDINLNGCKMSHGGAQCLLSLAEDFPWHRLRILNLGHNSLGNPAFTITFCPLLQNMTSLQALDISGNNLGAFAVEFLMAAISNLHSLRKLVCSQNTFRLDGFSEMNLRCSAIEELAVSFNFINSKSFLEPDQAFNRIIDANLRTCASLKKLDLSNNQIRDADLAGFHRLSYLTDLDLSCNSFGNEGCFHLAKMVRSSLNLSQLNIAGNHRVSVKGVRALLDECVRYSFSDDDARALLHVETNVSNARFCALAQESSDAVRFCVV